MADDDEKPPQTAKEYFERGNTHRKKGDPDGAIADYDEAIRLKPDYVEARGNRGIAWGEKGEYDKAIADFDEVIRINPNEEKSWYNRGKAWRQKGEYDKAIADYSEAIRLKPDYASAWNNRGRAWNDKGEYDKAIADFNEAIRLKPDNEKAWYNRGNTWGKKGEYDKAIADYDEALRLKPDYKDAIHNRALALALKSSEAESKEIAERLEKDYAKKLDDILAATSKNIAEDTEDFRKSYNDHKALSETLRKVAMALLVLIGVALPVILWIIYCNEKDSLSPWGLMPWMPVVAAISSPFFLLWWMLQRWSYEALTLAYGFQRKAIVEERVFRYAGDDPEFRKKLLETYIVHWMEKSPLEVMLTIGGKKGMGGGDSPTSTLLGKVAKTANDVIKEAGKDGAP